jgi:phage/conjugal plasmid C-4 type zinc finger TraR family protein
VSDLADLAQELEEMSRAQALERQFRAATINPDVALGNAPVRCVDCSITIPLARRRAVPGTKLCVDCKQQRDINRARR